MTDNPWDSTTGGKCECHPHENLQVSLDLHAIDEMKKDSLMWDYVKRLEGRIKVLEEKERMRGQGDVIDALAKGRQL